MKISDSGIEQVSSIFLKIYNLLKSRGVSLIVDISKAYVKLHNSIGRLAQPVRAPASHAGGHWFKSSIAQINITSSIFLLQNWNDNPIFSSI
jgi:hypothetical protein